MSKVINFGATVDDIPPDYESRFEAANVAGMTFNTDEATGDLTAWTDPVGGTALVRENASGQGIIFYPFRTLQPDGRWALVFDGEQVVRGSWTPALGASVTIIMVWEMDTVANMPTAYGAAFEAGNFNPIFGHREGAGQDGKAIYYSTVGSIIPAYSTQDYQQKRLIQVHRCENIAPGNNNIDFWINGTKGTGATGAADVSVSTFSFGGYHATTSTMPCKMFETLLWDRALTDEEVERVIEALSIKYNVPIPDVPAREAETQPASGRPLDYYINYDASAPILTYATSEQANDVDSWTDSVRGLTMPANTVATEGLLPALLRDADDLPHLRFYGLGNRYLFLTNLQTADPDAWAALDDASDVTVFVVVQHNNMTGQAVGNRWSHGFSCNAFGSGFVAPETTPFGYASGGFQKTTSNFNNRRVIIAKRNQRDGVDLNNVRIWCGAEVIYSAVDPDTAVQGSNFLTLGSFSTAANRTDCNIYELLIFDRALSDAEMEQMIAFLSAKWQVTNRDTTDEVIAPSSKVISEDVQSPQTQLPIVRGERIKTASPRDLPLAIKSVSDIGNYTLDTTFTPPNANGEALPTGTSFADTTAIEFYENNSVGAGQRPTLLLLRRGDYIRTSFGSWRVTGAPTDNTTSVVVPVEYFTGRDLSYPLTLTLNLYFTNKAKIDDRFPLTLTRLCTDFNEKYWFDARDTRGMTFDSGNPRDGGVVSSWADISGNVTMDTVNSGQNSIDYNPNVNGFPSVSGNGVDKSLESPTFARDQTVGGKKLFWSVTKWNGVINTQAVADFHSLLMGPRLHSGLNNDYISGRNHHCVFNTTAGGSGLEYTPSTVQAAGSRLDISLWLTERNGASDVDVRRWYNGVELPPTNSPNLDTSIAYISVGAAGGLVPSDGDLYEMGYIEDPDGFFSDKDVENLARWLCNRYGVEFVAETTPIDLAIATRSISAATAQHDCVYWFRGDKAGGSRWQSQPEVVELVRNMNDVDGTGPALLKTLLNRPSLRFESADNRHLRDADTYVWSESVTFPASTGVSVFIVARNNAKTNNAYLWEGASILRQQTTTGQILFRISGQSLVGAVDKNAEWIIAIGTFDDTTGDMTLDINDDAQVTVTAPAPSTPSTTRPNVGADNGATLPNDCDILEVAEWKHVLSAAEIASLKRYARERYADLFNA